MYPGCNKSKLPAVKPMTGFFERMLQYNIMTAQCLDIFLFLFYGPAFLLTGLTNAGILNYDTAN